MYAVEVLKINTPNQTESNGDNLDFIWKMAEPAWNWESKVERLRQILEKQALERTYDVCETARSTDLFSVGNISEVKKIESLFHLPIDFCTLPNLRFFMIFCIFFSFLRRIEC